MTTRIPTTQRELLEAGVLPTKRRITFPPEIETDEEREIYARLHDANPSAHLFNEATTPLLTQLTRHVISANKIARAIRGATDQKMLIALSKQQKDESMAIASLTTKLRMSPSSTADSRGNFKPKMSGPKPWEY